MNTITDKQITLLKKLDKENPLTHMTCTEYCWRKVMMRTFPEQDVFRRIDREAKAAEISDGNIKAGDRVRNKVGWTGTVESVEGAVVYVKLDDGQTKKFGAKFIEVID